MRVEIRHRMHGPWNTFVPGICHTPQPLPFLKSLLFAELLIMRVRFLESRDRGTEVADFGDDVQHAMRPDFLPPILKLAGEVHINAPVVGIPSDLPIEVEAAEDF